MLLFAAAVFGLIITPGPGVLSTAGVGAGFGYGAGLRYVAGLLVGANFAFLLVVSGVAALVLAEPGLRAALFWASSGYLLYLAAKIALAGSKIGFIQALRPPGFVGGVILNSLNPKAYVVAAALMGGFNFLPGDFAAETGLKLILYNLIWIPIHLLWLAAGVQLRALNLAAGAQRAINIAMAVSMLAVVGIAAYAQR